ncbi:hypothetical protein PDQ37_25840 [Bacillus cereus]|nr:hypothetical protein [Bacillus cereus]
MANNKLKINIDADTTEALKQMKEVTEAANECVAAVIWVASCMLLRKDKRKRVAFRDKG